MVDESREFIIARAGERCEYCQMHRSLQSATFHIEHVVPRALGGSNESTNLALACPSCNLHKADRIASQANQHNAAITFFNPRADDWSEHFEWVEYRLIGKTETGTATIKAIDLNHERRIRIRQAEQLFGLFPPDPSIGEA